MITIKMMTKFKLTLFTLACLAVGAALFISADHIDAPKVSDTAQDIADLFVFEGADSDNLVFAVTTQGLLSPGMTANAAFDENTLIEFNIDNDGDFVEDLVIQAIRRGEDMIVFGPVAPSMTGSESSIMSAADAVEVNITEYGDNPVTESNNGVTAFAGPRDDPFFFDLGRYSAILAGDETEFAGTGTDTFAGTNVLAVVVEVPKSRLGGSGTLNVWVETKLKR